MSASILSRDGLASRWSELEPRDRRALRLGGLALAVILPALLAWTVHDGLAARRAELAESRSMVTAAGRQVAARLAAGADITTASSDAAAWQARVTRVAARVGIDASSMSIEPQPDGRLRLGLRDAPYDTMMTLLGGLARWEGLTVVSADIARTSPGRVEASLVLRAP